MATGTVSVEAVRRRSAEAGRGGLGGAEAERDPTDREAERAEGRSRTSAGARVGYRGPPATKEPDAQKDFLAFAANVWNAGPSQLVLDGFRQQGKDLMDAYQYFYDANGKQVGYQNRARSSGTPGTATALALHRLRPLQPAAREQTEVLPSGRRRSAWPATDSSTTRSRMPTGTRKNTDLHYGLRQPRIAVGPRGPRRRLRRHLHPVPLRASLRRERTCRTARTTSR